MRFLTILLAAVVCCSSVLARGQDQWFEVKSSHFSVLTDGSEQSARELAMQFEQIRSVFAQLFFNRQIDQSLPVEIIALKNAKQLSDYAPLYQERPIDTVGFYLRSHDKSFVVLDLQARNRWETAFHEYTHLLLDSNLPDVPVWFSEGFAEFCSTIRISSKEAIIGRAPESALAIIHDHALHPAAVLLNVDHQSPLYNEDSDARSVFYAQSWLAVHYFWDNRKMDEIREYIDLTRRHVPPVEALKQALKLTPAQLETALSAYAHTEAEFVRIPLPEHLEHVSFAAHPIRALDAAAALADLHAHQDDHRQQSIAEFERILQQDPGNVAAHRGLGYALFTQQHLGLALPHLKKASQQAPQDWLVHYYIAYTMAQAHDDGYTTEIEKEARRVTELNPALADGYGLLGFALMTEHKTALAAEAYETALRLKPASEVYALNLAELYTLQGRLDQAKTLFDYLQSSQNVSIAMAAHSHLELMGGTKKSD